jgi:hypothetical protein
MQENESNKKHSCSLSILVDCISDPVLVVDAEDRTIGEKFTQLYGGEIIARMEMEVKRFG